MALLQPIALFTLPVKGVFNNLPPYAIPPDGLFDALNGIIKSSYFQPRPGLTTFGGAALAGRPVGAYHSALAVSGAFQGNAFQSDAFQTSANVPNEMLLAATTTTLYSWNGSAWVNVTDTAFTGGADNLAQFCGIQIGGFLIALVTNGFDPPKKLASNSNLAAPVGGSPPYFTDWTVAGDRVIGIRPPYDIFWTPVLNVDTWPSINVRSLSDTQDALVAIRNLGTSGVGVYKDASLWVGVQTGDPLDSKAFRFEFRGAFDGPAGPAAVVSAHGGHYYMTKAGRIGFFTGSSHRWVADGTWPLTQSRLDSSFVKRISGGYDATLDMMFFFYPRTGDNGDLKDAIFLQPPRPTDGIADYIAWPCRFATALSTVVDRRLTARNVLAFSSGGVGYTVAGLDDAGTAITGYWQTGILPATLRSEPWLAAKATPYRLSAVEIFAQRGVGFGSLSVKAVSSYILDTKGGTLSPAVTIDLTTVPPKDWRGVDVRGRLFGVRGEFTTPLTLLYQGARLGGYELEVL